MSAWLFYAGPENYLDASGEVEFAHEVVWSAAPDVKIGDTVLLYRRTLGKLTAEQLARGTNMPLGLAEALRRSGIGSDLAALWKVTSLDLGPLGPWASSCRVHHVGWIDPPLTLKELKANRPLYGAWPDLRWNFQAQGRDALEIPSRAWALLEPLVRVRLRPTS
jgi:hypothetical protein